MVLEMGLKARGSFDQAGEVFRQSEFRPLGRQDLGHAATGREVHARNASRLRKSITSTPDLASVRFVDSKIFAGDAETSADRAFIIRKPVPPDRTSSKFRRNIASWSRWATSWYTTSTEPIRPAYDS